MEKAEFSVHLGGDLYMDSNGVLSHGPELGKPIYSTPGGGLPVNLDTLKKTFDGIAKALPNKDDPKSREKFDDILNGIGMAAEDKENLIGALQAIGAVASVIGSVVPIVGAALAVLTLLLGLFKEGPSAVELLITRRFEDLARQIKTLEVLIQQGDLRNQRSTIGRALAALKNYVIELQNASPLPANLLDLQQDMRNWIGVAGIATTNLLDSSTWLASFNQNEFRWVWPWIANRLYTFPRAGAPIRATYPAPGAQVFDHALMVPLSVYAVTAYLTLLRAYTPEFRSTRENREDLWDFGVALETLAENMRGQGLARTVYTAADFQSGPGGGVPWGLGPEEVLVFGQQAFLAPGSTRWAVGAMDLRVHNDLYFTPGFAAGPIQFQGDQYAKQGLLNVRWIPPAVLEEYDEFSLPPGTRRRYRIVNPEECAQAANALAELDYADLLYSSGYLNLIHLITVLRNEATDPDHSQTVRLDPWLRRKPGAPIPVSVESEPIPLTGVISSVAQREPQEYRATVSLTTQPLGRPRALHYRICLRTLGGPWWREQDYKYFHQVGYANDPDPDHPGFKILVASTGTCLDEVELVAGESSLDAREVHDTAVLKAITYDWWIPVKGFPGLLDPSEAIKMTSLRAAGWEATGHATLPSGATTLGGTSPFPPPLTPSGTLWDSTALVEQESSYFASWLDAAEPPAGQHRKPAESEVHLDYALNWQGDRMTISLKNNRPDEDRNYVVYLVVEETLHSGVILHTTQRIPVIGQLTYVPQSFFDEEAEALARLSKALRDFAVRYAISVSKVPTHPPHPGDSAPVGQPNVQGVLGLGFQQIASDPVLRQLELGGLSTPKALEQLATLAAQHPPAVELLRTTLKDADISNATVKAFLDAASSQSATSGSAA